MWSGRLRGAAKRRAAAEAAEAAAQADIRRNAARIEFQRVMRDVILDEDVKWRLAHERMNYRQMEASPEAAYREIASLGEPDFCDMASAYFFFPGTLIGPEHRNILDYSHLKSLHLAGVIEQLDEADEFTRAFVARQPRRFSVSEDKTGGLWPWERLGLRLRSRDTRERHFEVYHEIREGWAAARKRACVRGLARRMGRDSSMSGIFDPNLVGEVMKFVPF